MSSEADAATQTDTQHGQDDHGEHAHHVVSVKLLVGVFLALLVLTFLTVAAIWVDLGSLNIWLAMGIATIKGTLVSLYFMHLRWDRPFNLFALIGSIFFVALFLGFCMRDVEQYKHTLDPMSPQEQEARNKARQNAYQESLKPKAAGEQH